MRNNNNNNYQKRFASLYAELCEISIQISSFDPRQVVANLKSKCFSNLYS